jgi:diguanylate cyclase (GGDEF)-like protein/PAS domain S-box-containing protein
MKQAVRPAWTGSLKDRQKIRGPQIAILVLLLLAGLSGTLLAPGLIFPSLLAIALLGLSLLAFAEWRAFQSIRRAYDLAMLAAHDGFWEWNPLSKKLHVGTRLLEILGYDEDFLPDTNAWLELVHPDDRATYNSAVSQHLKGKNEFFYCEYRVMAKDGTYRWIASRGLAVRDRHGKAFQMVGSVTDITERRNHQEEMEFLAQHDALTGLPNRLLFSQHLQETILAAREGSHKVAVLFIDLDRFKNINDTLGHRAGDQLLQGVAQRLLEKMPARCRLYRQGGDEFIVLISPVSDANVAVDAATLLKETVAAPFSGDESNFFTSASIGISLFPEDAADGETLLRHADTAMYEAKAAGGNTIRSHTPLMNQRVTFRMSLETRLRRALQANQLALYFQPQIDAQSGQLVGAEALLRWHDGENQIPPDHFIPVAEESGLIIPIGDWVIEQAIRQIAEWRHTFGDLPPIAINLSPRQFWRPALASLILEKLQAAKLPHSVLEVEITESVLLDADGSSIDELLKLRAAGIPIALDDFGTGYSSLSYLQRLPISTLKIDRSFINNLVLDDGVAGSEPLVKAIIAMAQSLSLRVVAEGVETVPQHRHLKSLGCDVIQGYLISRPLPAADFAASFLVDRNKLAVTVE